MERKSKDKKQGEPDGSFEVSVYVFGYITFLKLGSDKHYATKGVRKSDLRWLMLFFF
jgi:hypothetical protein